MWLPVTYNITAMAFDRPFSFRLEYISLQFSDDGVTWIDHVNDDGNILYPVMTEYQQRMLMDLRVSTVARALRLTVESNFDIPHMMFELLGYPFGKCGRIYTVSVKSPA